MQRRYAILALLAGSLLDAHAATIQIVNRDGTNEGFNDPTVVPAAGENTATTRGAQRLALFQRAANTWAATLTSNIVVKVGARFDPLECDAQGAVLGSAGPTTVAMNFPNAPRANTWYPIALAEALANAERNGANDEISATFNSAIDTACLGANTRWWYGFSADGNGNTIDLFPVVLHELGHGLGFISLVCDSPGGCGTGFPMGSLLGGSADAWLPFMRDTQTGKNWTSMTDAERAASMTNDPDLVWTGTNVTAALPTFQPTNAGVRNGFLRLHAPATLEPGSSVSHWTSAAASPNLLMEPALSSGVFAGTDITVALFRDIGWQIATAQNQAPSVTLPANFVVTEDSTTGLGGISFADPDAGDGPLTVTVSVPSGTLATGSCAGLAFGGSTGARTLQGTLTRLNACFQDPMLVNYSPAPNATAAQTLTVTVDDNGNTGSGGAKSDTETAAIAITAVNDAPTITRPASPYAALEDTETAPLTGISFADVDAGNAQVRATFAVPTGTIDVDPAAAVTIAGTAQARTVTGTLAAVNAAVATGVTYTPAAEASGDVTLTLTIEDQGASGTGGAKTATATATIAVAAVNDAPTLTVPPPFNATEGDAVGIGAIAIGDDATSGTISVTLAVTRGVLQAPGCGGVTIGGPGNARTASGTLADLALCLALPNGFLYVANDGAADDTLVVTVSDNGNTGSGGARTATGNVAITITPSAGLVFRNGFE